MSSDREVLQSLIEHREVEREAMLAQMRRIMSGEVSPVMIAALITALRVKGETVGEIAAAAQVMRELVTPVQIKDTRHLVDLCGTGGDGAHTFNISTCSMFAAAAAGARVAKHGGRSVSSSSGSADVLEALGGSIQLQPAQVARCLEETGIGFMFAPNHHAAMKHAAPVRKELGVRTLFNMLGPLTNPANAPCQLVGVFHVDLVGKLARVLQRLGARHAVVVHGCDGLDELTLAGATHVAEVKDGMVSEYSVTPKSFGLRKAESAALVVRDREESVAFIRQVLANTPGPALDIVLLNAGAALFAADVVDSIAAGVECARHAIDNGAAQRKMEQWVSVSQRLAQETADRETAA